MYKVTGLACIFSGVTRPLLDDSRGPQPLETPPGEYHAALRKREKNDLLVQWIERGSPKAQIRVRFSGGSQKPNNLSRPSTYEQKESRFLLQVSFYFYLALSHRFFAARNFMTKL